MTILSTNISGTCNGPVELAVTFTTDVSALASSDTLKTTVNLYINTSWDEPAKTHTYELGKNGSPQSVNLQSDEHKVGLMGDLKFNGDGTVTMANLNACHSGFVQIFSDSLIVAVL
jgi:hypothetical protein